jgi:hypothetical protein
MNKYVGLGFPEKDWIMGNISRLSEKDNIKIMGSFATRWEKIKLRINKADYFITGENRGPEFRLARKQIGFWRSYKNRSDVFRFPNWMWHLNWPEIEDQPPYPRYGMRLDIDRLMRPIKDTYSEQQLASRQNKAILFSKHLREPRRQLYEVTNSVLGCDGYGGAFNNDNRAQAKMPIMEGYRFSLCPENSIGDGYITEKIPEAFHSGCIPISWCRPEDLAEDFNPEAIVNLYGLDHQQRKEVLEEMRVGSDYFKTLIETPLLKKRPSLAPLINFINAD